MLLALLRKTGNEANDVFITAYHLAEDRSGSLTKLGGVAERYLASNIAACMQERLDLPCSWIVQQLWSDSDIQII